MALSPMMQHYFSVKEKYKDCIIFYRLGDFYEMFFDDAIKASAMLDLTLTGRDCGLEDRAPMCGVPYHACETYIAKLVEQGQKVAICEQVSDPALSKGMVEREVVRVVTAGTQTNDALIDEKKNNYICCAFKNGDVVCISWADITTGEFSVIEFVGTSSLRQAINHMLKLSVSEIICNDDFLFETKNFPEISRGILPPLSNYPTRAFTLAYAEDCLLSQFGAKTLQAYPIYQKNNAICACAGLIEYLKETQKHALCNINGVRYVPTDTFMHLDNSAIRNLELTKTLGEGNKYGSLLWLLDKTATPMGARLLNNLILSPLGEKTAICDRLDSVEELYNSTVIRLALADMLKQVKDVERLTGRISNGNVMPKDCLALAQSLLVVPNVKFQLSGFVSKNIVKLSQNLHDLSDLAIMLNKAIEDEKTPATLKDGGYIKKGFNAELDSLRAIGADSKVVLNELEVRERENTGIRTLRVGYNRVFGYFIEVSKSFKDKVPISYQRRQTLANSERYITDELKELEDRILNSQDRALKLEQLIYDKIKETLESHVAKLKEISSAIAMLDVLVSFAEISKSNRYVRPQIVNSNEQLLIKEGRHPVVEAISKEKFIPNDTLLDEGENRTMIITGPNMAGKSTYMRQTALITLMAHVGCFVPAKVAQIPVVDRIFTRIGASDNLIFDQSTFMVEMIEVASIIQSATKNSLLILDEVGRGTSTYDGLSIAWAVVEHITQKIKAKTLFATHYHELTDLENRLEGIKNYKIAVKEFNGNIVFLRKIMRGGTNKSFGIEVASLAGVPAIITSRAKEILRRVERGEIAVPDDCMAVEQDKEYSEIEKILKETDINNLSPVQAFMILGDLIEKVNK